MADGWTPNEIDLLIDLVRNQPDLFDQSRSGYSNCTTTDNIWRSIASNFSNKEVKACKKKWQILRTGYRTRRHDQRILHSADECKAQKKWVYFETLSFLEPFLRERATTSNLESSQSVYLTGEGSSTPNNNESSNEDFVGDQNEVSESPTETQGISHFVSQSVPLSSKRKRVDAHKNVDDAFVKFLKSKTESRVIASQQKKPVEQFFESLLPDFEKLPPNEQREFKLEIMTSLHTRLQKYNL